MPFNKTAWLFVLLACLSTARAQETKEEIKEQLTERLLENLEDEADYLDLLEQLYAYIDQPLNLNTVSGWELSQLGILNPEQISGIILHRQHFGPYLHIAELQVVDALDPASLSLLKYFVTVSGETGKWTDIVPLIKHSDKEFIMGGTSIFPRARGYEKSSDSTDAPLNGGPYRRFVRMRFSEGQRFSAGLNAESDAGESFEWSPQTRGFDFYSAHLMIGKIGHLDRLILGDFQADFGQGLTLGTGFNIGKSALSLRNKKCFNGLRPYRSFNENLFLRGAAAGFNFGKWQSSLLFSSVKNDANLAFANDTGDMEAEAIFTSLQNSGLHSTASELSDKNSIRSNTAAASIRYQNGLQQFGFTLVHQQFSKSYERGNEAYEQFLFSGKQYKKAGLDWDLYLGNVNIYGEVSLSDFESAAVLSGALISLGKKLDLSLLYRNYSRSFIDLYANAFAEQSSPRNEKGFYIGFQSIPNKKNTFSGYIDHYHFPWLSFRRDAPVNGRDLLFEWSHAYSKKNKFYIRLRDEIKGQGTAVDDYWNGIHADRRSSIRLNAEHGSGGVRLQSRAELSWYTHAEGRYRGALLLQDLTFKQWPRPIDFSARLAAFYTEDYSARIYAYERDLLYQFYIPAFSGTGARAMLLTHYKLNRSIDFWLKLAYTCYADRNENGSGWFTIEDNRRLDVKLQLRYRL